MWGVCRSEGGQVRVGSDVGSVDHREDRSGVGSDVGVWITGEDRSGVGSDVGSVWITGRTGQE